jgi:hypothetical protein
MDGLRKGKMLSRVRLGNNRRITLLARVLVPTLVLTIFPALPILIVLTILVVITTLPILFAPAAIGRDVPEKAKTAPSLTTPAKTQAKLAPSKSESELSENEIFDRLTGSDWRYPGDYWNIPDSPSDNRGNVTFNGENFSYPATQTWLPGRKIEIIISGISTAGTVREKALPPSFIDQFFSKLENVKKENERARKFPYQSPNGVTSLKWNFSKDDKRASKEWAKDSTWKVEPGSTPPQQIEFAKDGHFDLNKDEQGNWIRGPRWSLVNRDGMHIFFHPTGSYCDSTELEPIMPSDHELTLILHVPTYTKFGDKLYEHRFVAPKTK